MWGGGEKVYVSTPENNIVLFMRCFGNRHSQDTYPLVNSVSCWLLIVANETRLYTKITYKTFRLYIYTRPLESFLEHYTNYISVSKLSIM